MKTILAPRKKPASRTGQALARLYEKDETAWLEKSVCIIREGRFAELDYTNLIDCLEAMAINQRREVRSRLIRLLAHLLKWEFQPARRSRSWLRSIVHQRSEFEMIFTSKTLKNHALGILAKTYASAVKAACADTGLAPQDLPESCPYTFDFLLSDQLPGSDEPE